MTRNVQIWKEMRLPFVSSEKPGNEKVKINNLHQTLAFQSLMLTTQVYHHCVEKNEKFIAGKVL